MTTAQSERFTESGTHMFPPALVPVLRDRATPKCASLNEVNDVVLSHVLTTIFWAGLETYEGVHNATGVVFLGRSLADFIIPEGVGSGVASLYQWKVLRFNSPRPFTVPELVKLAVAGTDHWIYSAVNVLADGSLAITGLAREGFTVDPDPFVKIIAPRPGCLSIRSGPDLLLGYERGAILTGGEDLVFSAGPVRRALEATARAAGLSDDVVPDYVNAVRSLVREMASHAKGGILIISLEEHPQISGTATYGMALDSSLASLLQLARRLGRNDRPSRTRPLDPKATGPSNSHAPPEHFAFRGLLRNAFLTEAERVIEEIGALTAIDGAILLSRELALVAFGVILPLGHPTAVEEATDAEGSRSRLIDLGNRGTRHRAAATYAAEHPGSVVFVASEDGYVSCMFRDLPHEHALLWRLGPSRGAHSVI